MPIKSFRPITPSLRFATKLVNDDITTDKPHKPLLAVKPRTGGRNSTGSLSVRHHGGGHKQKLRIIDFKRDKFGIPGTVATIEYDPNRSSRIALIHYADGEKRYIIQPVGLTVGQSIMSGPDADILVGNALPLKSIPSGTTVHNIELRPGKAGRNRWKGIRPSNRGVSMNPVDHPHGGGEGKTSGGRHPVTPWGQPTRGFKTRNNKRTNQWIVTRKSKKR